MIFYESDCQFNNVSSDSRVINFMSFFLSMNQLGRQQNQLATTQSIQAKNYLSFWEIFMRGTLRVCPQANDTHCQQLMTLTWLSVVLGIANDVFLFPHVLIHFTAENVYGATDTL